MKKYIYFIIIAFVFSYCDKSVENEEAGDSFYSVGELHNVVTNHFFSKYLKTESRSSNINSTSYNFTEIDFERMLNNPERTYDSIIASINDVFNDSEKCKKEIDLLCHIMPSFTKDGFVKAVNEGNSVNALSVNELIKEIPDLTDTEIKNLIAIRENIELFFSNQISESEFEEEKMLCKEVFFRSSDNKINMEDIFDIALNSSKYWNTFFSSNEVIITRGWSQKDTDHLVEIAWADVCGGIFGLYGAVTGSLIAVVTSVPGDTRQ
jgi:hypothetical protein